MIEISTNKARGSYKRAGENREKIRAWFLANPGETITCCAKSLGFTWITVKKHVISIQKEG